MSERVRRRRTWDGVECLEVWTNECRGDTCKVCGFCPVHAYEANRQGEGRCIDCVEEKP